MTVADLGERMTSVEYLWWEQFYLREHDERVEAS